MDPDEVAITFAEHCHRIREVLPRADLYLTGSASVADLQANDIDVVGLVEDVVASAARLRGLYEPLYPNNWSDDWAAFRELGPPQVDVVLTRRGTKWDARHRIAWDLLRQDRELRAEFATIKASPTDYQQQKSEFFERIVARLQSERD